MQVRRLQQVARHDAVHVQRRDRRCVGHRDEHPLGGDPPQLSSEGDRVRNVLQHLCRDDGPERTVGERQGKGAVGQNHPIADIGMDHLSDAGPVDLDTEDLRAAGRQGPDEGSGPTSDVEHRTRECGGDGEHLGVSVRIGGPEP